MYPDYEEIETKLSNIAINRVLPMSQRNHFCECVWSSCHKFCTSDVIKEQSCSVVLFLNVIKKYGLNDKLLDNNPSQNVSY